MSEYVGGVIEALSKSLSLKVWFYYLLLFISELLCVGVIAFAALLALSFTLFGLGVFSSPTALLELLLNPAKLFSLTLLVLAEALVFLLLLMLIKAFFDGARFALAKGLLEKGSLSLLKPLSEAKQRLVSVFGVNLVWTLILLAILALLMISVVLYILSRAPELETTMLTGFSGLELISTASALALLLLLVWYVVSFLLAPFMYMALPAALFEKKPVMTAFKRGFGLVKGKYLSNLLFILIVGFIAVVVNMGALFIVDLLFLPLAPPMGHPNQALSHLLFILMIKPFVLSPIWVWTASFATIAITKLYFLNASVLRKK